MTTVISSPMNKKYLYLIACLFAACLCLTLASCSSDEEEDPQADIKWIFGTWCHTYSDEVEYWTFSKDATGHKYQVYGGGKYLNYKLGRDDYSWYIDNDNRIQCRQQNGFDQGILIKGKELYFDDYIKMKKVSTSTTVPVRASDAIKP